MGIKTGEHAVRGRGLDREVSLTDSAARRWMADLGWHAQLAEGTMRLYGDRFTDAAISVARIWLSAARLRPVEHHGVLRVVLVVDGTAVLEARNWRAELKPWDLLLLDATTPTWITASDGFGFMQFIAENERLAMYHPRPGVPILFTEPRSAQLFASMVSTTIGIGLVPEEPGTPFIARAFENIVATVMSRSTVQDAADEAWRAPSDLTRALAAIAAHHTDPEFDVEHLAAVVHLSRRQLVHIFSATGMTPSAAIRRARLATADSTSDSIPISHGDRIARAAGFRDQRALRRARELDRAGEDPC